jgi:hypothetical protein
VVANAQQVVHSVVVEATDAGGTRTSRFCFEVQHLTNEAGLPKE